MTLENLTFKEYIEREIKKYYEWFYSQDLEIQERELDKAVRWYNER